MEVKFTDSFFESLKTLSWHESKIYKTWSFFWYKIPAFVRNIWRFRKELYEYRRFDWRYNIAMFRRGLELEADYIEKHGLEVEVSRLKKVEKMRRAIEIIKLHEDGDFIKEAEKEFGYEFVYGGFDFVPTIIDGKELHEMVDTNTKEDQERNTALMHRAWDIEKETIVELFEILKGQDYEQFNKDVDWNDQFDGTGIFGWWD